MELDKSQMFAAVGQLVYELGGEKPLPGMVERMWLPMVRKALLNGIEYRNECEEHRAYGGRA